MLEFDFKYKYTDLKYKYIPFYTALENMTTTTTTYEDIFKEVSTIDNIKIEDLNEHLENLKKKHPTAINLSLYSYDNTTNELGKKAELLKTYEHIINEQIIFTYIKTIISLKYIGNNTFSIIEYITDIHNSVPYVGFHKKLIKDNTNFKYYEIQYLSNSPFYIYHSIKDIDLQGLFEIKNVLEI